MTLTKRNQELRRALMSGAFALEDAAQSLVKLAGQVSDLEGLEFTEKVAVLQQQADQLMGFADEVKDGIVIRAREGETFNG